jgi:chromosome segregation protein
VASETKKREQEQLVARLQAESQELRQDSDDVRHQVTALKVTLAGLREREESTRIALERIGSLREELHGRQVMLGQDRVEAKAKQETLWVEAADLQTRLEVLFKRRVDEQSALDGLRDLFEESRQDIERREAALKQLRSKAGELRDELSTRQMKSRELHLERDHLRQVFLEKFRLDLASEEVIARRDETFDEGTGRQRREYLQRRIEEIGEVNLMAIEEFQELEERYTFLSKQQDDLQQSLDGLQAAITKINRTTRKRFREAFELVNEKFREVFPRLFNGGQAELRLTDENDLLETGVEIVAQPPGKKLQNVTLLSGGEKALTAVALIFSIFMIKPSPFCLLDEVDAPLDDANIGRFNDMVELMSDTSQFIIITHNKRTMEIADNLYGITMEEPGISKMVSVRMKEVA